MRWRVVVELRGVGGVPLLRRISLVNIVKNQDLLHFLLRLHA